MTLVIYDISENRTRSRIATACRRFGLSRIQKSAFLGDISSARRRELVEVLKRLLRGEQGNIQVFVICRPDMALRTVIGEVLEEDEDDIIFV
ncbi:CRISPR-associated endonuclease Cas2 [Geoglobus acetivorans]|uniref:CRISPR-associated endoribonuclease Cas2 n=1 Tax=Geoglobus acetivorans TaxID=565033 RepID=A0ABZ3H2S9_GEOAI|nr:CRISPR-associated endonuclease Cas2 [Geoglobus acetivorans]